MISAVRILPNNKNVSAIFDLGCSFPPDGIRTYFRSQVVTSVVRYLAVDVLMKHNVMLDLKAVCDLRYTNNKRGKLRKWVLADIIPGLFRVLTTSYRLRPRWFLKGKDVQHCFPVISVSPSNPSRTGNTLHRETKIHRAIKLQH